MFFSSGKKQFLTGWRSVNSFYAHLQRGTRVVLLVAVVLALLCIIYLVQGLFNKQKASADLAKFYPAKCLGGWQYTAHAENVPDLDTVASIDDFNDINSAVLDNAMAQLYCSEFNGEDPIGTVPKKLTLRLSLGVKPKVVVEAPIETETSNPVSGEVPVITTDPASGSETPTTEVPGDTPVSSPNPGDNSQPVTEPSPAETPAPVESPVPAAEPAVAPVSEPVPSPAPVEAPAPAPAPSAEPTSLLPKTLLDQLFAWFTVGTARAQEASSSTPEEAVTEQAETPKIVPVLSEAEAPVLSGVEGEVPAATAEQASSSVETSPEASSTVPIEEVVTPEAPVMPSDALLEVSYTLDGQTWKSLGWVAESNWREASFDVPLEGISDWSNLDWLQVRFDRVASIDANQPVLYLDGMWLEAEYDSLDIEKNDIDIDQPDLKKDKALKQKVVNGFAVINVLRSETKKKELWYKKSERLTDYWKKIEVDDQNGYPVLLDLRSDVVFFVSYRQDRKMLASYNLLTGNSSLIDVVPGGLSNIGFEEMAEDGSGLELNNLYFIDDSDSYYFSK